MNPVAREEAIKEAEAMKAENEIVTVDGILDVLSYVFERYGANARTAYTNAQEIYREVYR